MPSCGYASEYLLHLLQVLHLSEILHDDFHLVAVVHAEFNASVEDALIA